MESRWQEEYVRLWDELVPKSGQAATVQGELIRCAGKATDEAYRNGNLNWKSGYKRLIRFLMDTLDDPSTFDPQQRQKIRAAAESIINSHRTPDLSGLGSSYYYLTEMAVRWCMAHPEPVPHVADETVRV